MKRRCNRVSIRADARSVTADGSFLFFFPKRKKFFFDSTAGHCKIPECVPPDNTHPTSFIARFWKRILRFQKGEGGAVQPVMRTGKSRAHSRPSPFDAFPCSGDTPRQTLAHTHRGRHRNRHTQTQRCERTHTQTLMV